MDEEKNLRKKSGQIPPFGNWENANDLPITQYFECARQAGLLRFSHSSGDLYAVDLKNISPPPTAAAAAAAAAPTTKKMSGQVSEEKRGPNEEQGINEPPKKQTYYLSKSQPQKQRKAIENVNRTATATAVASKTVKVKVKAVDEDLYKIPPDLLRPSKAKPKKRLGFVSRCLVPDCMV